MSESQWVYLMRGLPSCGKSHTARRLVGDSGLVCETDEYFLTEVGDDPEKFDYRDDLMERARKWNFDRFKFAIAQGLSPIVVDRGNSLSLSSQVYVRYASEHGYEVRLCEPESEWWQEIRVLLKNKDLTSLWNLRRFEKTIIAFLGVCGILLLIVATNISHSTIYQSPKASFVKAAIGTDTALSNYFSSLKNNNTNALKPLTVSALSE